MTYQLAAWGFPDGFGVPVYGLDVGLWPDHDRQVPKMDVTDRWPERPAQLRARYELGQDGLRPLNDLSPDAIAISPHHNVDWKGESRLVYRPIPLYRRDQAIPATETPTPREAAADRNYAINKSRDILRDPTARIIAINTIGTFNPRGDLYKRTAICEVAVLDTRGRTLLDIPVDPEWPNMRGQRNLRRCGLTPAYVRSGAAYWLEPRIQAALEGNQVVCQDRASVYGALYCDQELSYVEEDGALPNGLVHPSAAATLGILGASRWECARVLTSLFHGVWFEPVIRAVLHELPAPQRAHAQAQEVLHTLRQIATTQEEQKGISPTLKRRRYPTRRHPTFRQEFIRDPAKRALILDRCKGSCENPTCTDTGYQRDRTFNNEPLLQIDHITPLGRRGEDEIFNMIAVCGNCHDRKTRGRQRSELERQFRAAVLAKRRRPLGPPT